MYGALAAVVLASEPIGSEVTVYNQGFALVKEQRSISVKQGVQEVPIPGVAARIESNSVSLKSVSSPGSLSILEQNYRFDLINPLTILNKSVGKTIKFRRVHPNGQVEVLIGTLISSPTAVLSVDGGQSQSYNGLVMRLADGRVILNPTGEIEVESIPEGLISKPSLVWLLDAAQAGEQKVEVSYLTQGMSWTADYVLSLDKAGKLGDLKGWVTLVNQSGAAFKDSKLKLLAGEVFRPGPAKSLRLAGAAGPDMRFKSADMVEESFAEYHLYTAPRPVTILENEQKQVSLLEGLGVPVKSKIVLDATAGYGRWTPQQEGEFGTGPIKPLVSVVFKNDKESHLGMPMPAGRIKVFQKDSSDSLQMLGEASIDHTPRNETLNLPVGRSFDIVGSRRRVSFEWLSRRKNRDGKVEVFEVEVRNRKETAATVHVIERAYGEYKISKNSDPFEKLDSDTWQFVVTLKPNEVKKITYTLTTTWP